MFDFIRGYVRSRGPQSKLPGVYIAECTLRECLYPPDKIFRQAPGRSVRISMKEPMSGALIGIVILPGHDSTSAPFLLILFSVYVLPVQLSSTVPQSCGSLLRGYISLWFC